MELAADPRFRTNPDRVAHRSELIALLEARFAARPADQWLAALNASGVPAGKVRGVLDALRAAERAGRPGTARVPHPAAGEVQIGLPPFSLGTGMRPLRAPPLLGEHTNELLAALGYGREERGRLRATGIVDAPDV
jgi:crotonobetainyl-CoA:carnitine CoA-transferase CaiB-like acyl-CoA transferase